jgi:alkyl hydroperoxide reductase subunit AhpC
MMTLQHGVQLTLGQIAPDFEAEATNGPIGFSAWAKESRVVFFSHPRDLMPVCTTELGEAAPPSSPNSTSVA